jgi:protein-tyrosine phosphatase
MSAYEIVPRVWFGAAEHTYNAEFMLQITHIVNVDDTPTSTNIWARAGRQFLHLPSEDNHTFPILQTHSESLFEFIERALSNPDARVYIHCYMGLNRSAVLAVAYAARVLNTSATEIIASIRANGRPILLNSAFENQLTK